MRPDRHALPAHERTALEAAIVTLLPDARAEPDGFALPASDGSGAIVARLTLGSGGRPDDVPSFHLAPLVPGSFLHGALRLGGERGDADFRQARTDAPLGPATPDPSPSPDADWHYASMTLRPGATGSARHGIDEAACRRITVYLSRATKDVRRTASAIAAVRTSLEEPFALAIAGRDGGRERIADRLARAHGIEVRCVACDPDEPRGFFDSLAGVDLALFEDGDGRLADAIEVGVPVRLLDDPAEAVRRDGGMPYPARPGPLPPGFVAELRTVGADIVRQRACLARALDPAGEGTLVGNDLRALHRALLARFAAAALDVRLVAPRSRAPVIPRRPRGAPVAARGRLRLDGPRRKLAKLRESPARFVRDSRLPFPRRPAGRRR